MVTAPGRSSLVPILAMGLLLQSLLGMGLVVGQVINPIVLSNVELVTVEGSSAAITWVTNLASDSRVQWGTTTALGQEAVVNGTTNYHVGWMDDLVPGTHYYYRVGSGGSWSDIFSLTTLEPPDGGLMLTFAIVADPHVDADGSNSASGSMMGDGPRLLSSTLSQIMDMTDVRFVVLTGDLTNGAQADYELFAETIDALDVPWYPVLGNWDKNEEDWWEYYSDHIGRPVAYYSFDAGGYHFVVLDSAVQGQVNGALDDAQMDWLEEDLDANDQKPTLILLHHPADSTDEIYGLEPSSKQRLDDILGSRPWAFSLTAGHNHQNVMTAYGMRLYVTTASTVQYPIGHSIVRLYGEGYTQAFLKTESELATSEESRIRMNTAAGDPNEDESYLGVTLEDRNFVAHVPRNRAPSVTSVSVNPSEIQVGQSARVSTSATDPDGDTIDYHHSVTGGYIEGSGPTVTWYPPEVAGIYSVTVKVSDHWLSSEPMTAELEVKERLEDPVVENGPPVVDSIGASQDRIEVGLETKVTVEAFDPDGDILEYEYRTSGGRIIGSGREVTYRAPSYPGTFTVSVRVSDGMDRSDWVGVDIMVFEPEVNHAPVVSRVLQSSTSVRPGETIDIQVTAYDEDGDSLTYNYRADGGLVSGTGGTVKWIAPLEEGVYGIDIWVSDGEEDSKKSRVTVSVVRPLKRTGSEGVPGFEGAALLLSSVAIAILIGRRRMMIG